MPNNRRRLVGRVVSDKMDKTVTVLLENRSPHPIYKKIVVSTKKVHAHDENNEVKVGSLVRIVESKPLSKTKRWVVEAVLAKPGETFVTRLADEAIVLGEIDDIGEASDTEEVAAVPEDAGEAEAADSDDEAASGASARAMGRLNDDGGEQASSDDEAASSAAEGEA
jgi:small subunit ribosomal protein S17